MLSNQRNFFSIPSTPFILAGVVLLVGGCAANAQVVTVNTVNDVVDFSPPQQAANLPGPDGKVSFREAVVAVNNTSGPQTIEFAIPQSEWWLYSNLALLRLESSAFSLTDDETTIDFSSQTAFTGDTNPDGNEVGIYGLEPNGAGSAAIFINGENCVIKGLDVVHQRGYAIQIRGNNNRVIDCTISGPLFAAVSINGGFNGEPATGNVIGGIAPGEGNRLSAGNSGVRIDGPAENNVVIGNTLSGSFWGAEIRTPTCCPGNIATNNRIGGPTQSERNIIAGSGKYGEEGFPTGGQVAVQYSPDNIVEGNYVGVLADGLTVPAGQRGPVGVEVRSSPGTIVRDNLIAGILVVGVNHYAGQRFGDAIRVMGDCDGSIIQGNRIGVGGDGETAIPNRGGIVASYWSVNGMPVTPGPVLIGGPDAGEANIIAHSETTGVQVQTQINRVTISANSIFSNSALGIDLRTNSGGGVTPNDPGDGDTGGNDLQNFPELNLAESDVDSTHLAGTFNSTPNSQFTLEFFWNEFCDPTGFGEGQAFLGAIVVNTDSGGNAAFDANLSQPASADSFVTATATNSTGSTSEFSSCQPVVIVATPRAADITQDGVVNVNDLLVVINSWGACPKSQTCAADIAPTGGDLIVNVNDLLAVINDWG